MQTKHAVAPYRASSRAIVQQKGLSTVNKQKRGRDRCCRSNRANRFHYKMNTKEQKNRRSFSDGFQKKREHNQKAYDRVYTVGGMEHDVIYIVHRKYFTEYNMLSGVIDTVIWTYPAVKLDVRFDNTFRQRDLSGRDKFDTTYNRWPASADTCYVITDDHNGQNGYMEEDVAAYNILLSYSEGAHNDAVQLAGGRQVKAVTVYVCSYILQLKFSFQGCLEHIEKALVHTKKGKASPAALRRREG